MISFTCPLGSSDIQVKHLFKKLISMANEFGSHL